MAPSFIDAAYKVLSEEKTSLTARELVDIAIRRGLLSTSGSTPWKTMNARLSTDILKHKDKSVFMRTDTGRFALRAWNGQINEYVADRRKTALIDEDVLVFDRDILRYFVKNNGLDVKSSAHDELISKCYPMKRRLAEDDFSVIQLVSAYLVQNDDEFLTYKRTRRLPENRLHGVYSVIFGGHLNPNDIMPLFRFNDPAQALMLLMRELYEELIFPTQPAIEYLGLLYDPRREVSQQHLAVVFDVYLKEREVKVGERGFLTDLQFESIACIERRISEFENWSELLIDYKKRVRK